MKCGAVLGDAGGKVGSGTADGEENQRSSGRGASVIPAVDEVPGSSEKESGAERPEENREGRPAADYAGRDVAEVIGKGDDARPEIGLLVAKEGGLEAGADGIADDVDVYGENKVYDKEGCKKRSF